MAKELPYFKFYCSEWSDGDITLEDYAVQGLFTNICAYYWSNDCDVDLIKLRKKFRECPNEHFEVLINANIIKINGGKVHISFLDEQLSERSMLSKTNSKNGALGGRPRKEESENKPNALISKSETKPKQKQYREEEKKEEEKRKEQFDIFWDSYAKKNDFKKCYDKFIRLSDGDIQKILDSVNFYVSKTPEVKFRKNPLTWLNGQCWNDEPAKENQPNLFESNQRSRTFKDAWSDE